MSYAAEHASAYADILAAGAAVTLRRKSVAHTQSTDAVTQTPSTIAGAACQVRGRPQTYEALKLVESDAPTLLFAAATYGDAAELGDELTWGGKDVEVVSIDATAPDGTPIVARIVVSR